MRPRRANDHARPAIGGFGRQSLDRLAARILKRRFEDEVLRRIAGHEELREHKQIGAAGGRKRPRVPGLLQVALDVADDRIELGDGDLERIGQ